MNKIETTSRFAGSGSRPTEANRLYPSYVDLDPLLDVGRLKALDGLLLDGVRRRIDEPRDLKFCTGPFVLNPTDARIPGPQMVYLSRPTVPDNYYLLDRPECWEPTEAATEFAPLMDFIATLPFKATARMLIIYDQAGRAVPAHRDHDDIDLCHEFIWFRTNLDKPFYMLDPITNEKRYVRSHAAWFDTVNQFHGADGNGRLSISIRVDGIFDDDFRRRIPASIENKAAAPALWASEMVTQ
jgi:hypothetical protein